MCHFDLATSPPCEQRCRHLYFMISRMMCFNPKSPHSGPMSFFKAFSNGLFSWFCFSPCESNLYIRRCARRKRLASLVSLLMAVPHWCLLIVQNWPYVLTSIARDCLEAKEADGASHGPGLVRQDKWEKARGRQLSLSKRTLPGA